MLVSSQEEKSDGDERKERRFRLIHDGGEIFDVENFVADFSRANRDEGETENGLDREGDAEDADLERRRKRAVLIDELRKEREEKEEHFRIHRVHEKSAPPKRPFIVGIRFRCHRQIRSRCAKSAPREIEEIRRAAVHERGKSGGRTLDESRHADHDERGMKQASRREPERQCHALPRPGMQTFRQKIHHVRPGGKRENHGGNDEREKSKSVHDERNGCGATFEVKLWAMGRGLWALKVCATRTDFYMASISLRLSMKGVACGEIFFYNFPMITFLK